MLRFESDLMRHVRVYHSTNKTQEIEHTVYHRDMFYYSIPVKRLGEKEHY